MQRYEIENEPWFEAARAGLLKRAFRLRLQPRSIVIEKDGRLPRIVGSAREFLEFAERQGLEVTPGAYIAADAYGDGRHETPFDRAGAGAVSRPAGGAFGRATAAEPGPQRASAAEARLSELAREQERVASERRASAETTQALEARCVALAAELTEARQQRDLYQMSVAAAEARLRTLQAALDGPAEERGPDKKFNQLRRFLARELHPDLAGEDAVERRLREGIFKRVWSKIEQLQ